MGDSTRESGRAAELFRTHVERVAAGAPDELEPLCAAHPEHASELRARHAEWRALMGLVEGRLGAERTSADLESGLREWPELSKRLNEREQAWERYEDEGELARGGVGAIHRVWDRDLQRHLALKRLRGVDRAEALERLVEEAQVTGQLDHPGIVPVHDVGLDGEGRLYFTMKLVRGEDLTSVLRAHRSGEAEWSLPRVLNVLLRVCEAVAYAHEKGVVHRDLKPSNVRVGQFGEVYVMDWGLARVQGREEPAPAGATQESVAVEGGSSSALLTEEGAVLGTPVYMPPEQARGEREAIGPHSDVYALGAILYELLAGAPPYAGPSGSSSPLEVVQVVCERAPDPLLRIAPDAPAALVSISERAMQREPERRYPSVLALSEDLRAFLEQRVVVAHDAGTWGTLRLWARRNRVLVIAGGLVATALLVGALISFLFGLDARREAARAERRNYAALMLTAEDALAEGRPSSARQALERAPLELRGWEWRQLDARLKTTRWRLQTAARGNRVQLAVADEAGLGVLLDEKRILTWSVADGTMLSAESWKNWNWMPDIRWTPEHGFQVSGNRLPGEEEPWTRFVLAEGRFWIKDLDPLGAGLATESLELRSPGAFLKSIVSRGELALWADQEAWVLSNLATGERLWSRPREETGFMARGDFTPDLRVLAVPQESHSISLYRNPTRGLEAEGPYRLRTESFAQVVSLGRDGRSLIAHNDHGALMGWRLEWGEAGTGGPVVSDLIAEPESRGMSKRVAMDPLGRYLVVGEIEGEALRVYDWSDGTLQRSVAMGSNGISRLRFSHDGNVLVAANRTGELFAWSVETLGLETSFGAHDSFVYSVRVSPSGERVASAGWDGLRADTREALPGCLRLWDADTGAPLAQWGEKVIGIQVHWLSDERLLLLHSVPAVEGSSNEEAYLSQAQSQLSLIDATNGDVLARRTLGTRMQQNAWVAVSSADDRLVVIIDGKLERLDVESLEPLDELRVHPVRNLFTEPKNALAFSADGALLAWSVDNTRGVVEVTRWEELWRETTDSHELERLVFSPDGRSLFASHDQGGLERRSARSGELEWEQVGARGRQFAIAVHPDGSRVFTGGVDGTVAVFDAHDGVLLSVLEGHDSYIYELEFDPWRDALLSASGDHTLRRWSTRPVTELGAAVAERAAAVERLTPRLEQLRQIVDDDLERLRGVVLGEEFAAPFDRKVALQIVDGWAWANNGGAPR